MERPARPRSCGYPAGDRADNQGGVDISANGRKDLSPGTRVAGNVEYLSSYVYRLVFDDNYTQAVNSEVLSTLALTHEHNGYIPSGYFGRLQTFASTTAGDEARILHLPTLRFDTLDRPLANSMSIGSEFHDQSLESRGTGFSRAQRGPYRFLPSSIHANCRRRLEPGSRGCVPRNLLFRKRDARSNWSEWRYAYRQSRSAQWRRSEASVDLRPPALERDFTIGSWNRELRHVIEPEPTYHFVGGIGADARNVLLVTPMTLPQIPMKSVIRSRSAFICARCMWRLVPQRNWRIAR